MIYEKSYKKGGKVLIQLKEILKKLSITQLDIANELGIRSLSTVNQKLNNKSEFTVKEAILLRDLIVKKGKKKYTIEKLFEEE